MISSRLIVQYLNTAMPDADVVVTDKTGVMDHYRLRVVSEAFSGKNLLDRRRMVFAALQEPMADGRIHALEIQSYTPDEAVTAVAAG